MATAISFAICPCLGNADLRKDFASLGFTKALNIFPIGLGCSCFLALHGWRVEKYREFESGAQANSPTESSPKVTGKDSPPKKGKSEEPRAESWKEIRNRKEMQIHFPSGDESKLPFVTRIGEQKPERGTLTIYPNVASEPVVLPICAASSND